MIAYLISDKNILKKKKRPKYIEEAELYNKIILENNIENKIIDWNIKNKRMKRGRSEKPLQYEGNE